MLSKALGVRVDSPAPCQGGREALGTSPALTVTLSFQTTNEGLFAQGLPAAQLPD